MEPFYKQLELFHSASAVIPGVRDVAVKIKWELELLH